jgi:hypothetical protein
VIDAGDEEEGSMLAKLGVWLPDGSEIVRGAPWAALPSLVVLLFGGFDDLLRSLMVAVLLDVLTGVSCAFIRRRLASYQLMRGVVRKTLYFAAVALAVLADGLLPGVREACNLEVEGLAVGNATDPSIFCDRSKNRVTFFIINWELNSVSIVLLHTPGYLDLKFLQRLDLPENKVG